MEDHQNGGSHLPVLDGTVVYAFVCVVYAKEIQTQEIHPPAELAAEPYTVVPIEHGNWLPPELTTGHEIFLSNAPNTAAAILAPLELSGRLLGLAPLELATLGPLELTKFWLKSFELDFLEVVGRF